MCYNGEKDLKRQKGKNTMSELDMISALSEAFGPSGFEDDVLSVLRAYAPQDCSVTEDSLRNLYLRRPGGDNKPVVMLDAHSDEIGFMVQAIRPDGTLKFLPLGGWTAANIPAHRVLVRAKDGRLLPGVTGTKPPHFLTEAEKNKAPDVGSMWIDVGASSVNEAREAYGIRPGAPGTDILAVQSGKIAVGLIRNMIL